MIRPVEYRNAGKPSSHQGAQKVIKKAGGQGMIRPVEYRNAGKPSSL